MIKKYQKQLALLLLLVVALLSFQFYLTKNSIKLQQYEIANKTREDFKEVVTFLEDNYYCFKSYASLPIKQWDTFFVMYPGANGLDSVNFSTGKAGKVNDSIKRQQLRFPYDALAQIEFSFEFEAPPRNVDTTELTEVDKRMAEAFGRYIRYKNIHIIDTVYLNEQIRAINESLPKGIVAAVDVKSPESDSILFTSNITSNKSFGELQIRVNDGSVFLPVIPLAFKLYDSRPFFSSVNSLFLLVSIVLFALLIMLLLSFVKSLLQQAKLVQLKNELLANITHEFNTPVTNIALALKSLKVEGERNQMVAGIISEENQRIKSNIELILSTASIQNGIQDIEFNRTNVHSLINTISESLKINVEERGGTILFNLNATNDAIMGDEVHLTNLIHNLVDNAIKYSDDELHVEINSRNDKNNLLLSIKDKGIGISEEDQKMVFEKFFRAVDKNRHDVKGFGFGLHYVQMIAKAHKGSVSLKSKLGVGSEFIIKIPTIK